MTLTRGTTPHTLSPLLLKRSCTYVSIRSSTSRRRRLWSDIWQRHPCGIRLGMRYTGHQTLVTTLGTVPLHPLLLFLRSAPIDCIRVHCQPALVTTSATRQIMHDQVVRKETGFVSHVSLNYQSQADSSMEDVAHLYLGCGCMCMMYTVHDQLTHINVAADVRWMARRTRCTVRVCACSVSCSWTTRHSTTMWTLSSFTFSVNVMQKGMLPVPWRCSRCMQHFQLSMTGFPCFKCN